MSTGREATTPRDPRRGRRTAALRRALAAALGALALAAGPAGSQEPPAPATPDPAPPAAIPVAEIPARADALEARLGEIREAASIPPAVRALRDGLPAREARLDRERAELAGLLEARPSVGDLSALGSRWTAIADQLEAEEQRLADRTGRIEVGLGALGDLGDRWQRTREAARAQGAPGALLGRAEEILDDIAAVRRDLEARRRALLDLQGRLVEQRRQVAGALAAIEAARERVLADLLAPSQPPLWRARPEAGPAGAPPPPGTAELLRPALEYVREHPARMGVHAGLLAALALLATRGRRGLARRLREDAAGADAEERDAAGRVLEHPVAGALVLALLATPWIHPLAPRALLALGSVLLLAPALLIVLRTLLPGPLRPALYALAALFLADLVRGALEEGGLPLAARLLFLGEMAFLVGVLVWMRRPARMAELPARLLRSPWMRGLSLWLRAVLAAGSVGLVADVLGYGRLALLVGEAALGASYLALLLFAGARIAAGLAGVGLRSRLLRRSHMIARNTDLFVRGVQRVIRTLAAVTWVLGLLSLLALREPVLGGLASVLSTPFGYGSFSISLGGLLAFVLTLVASWLLGRFLHFALNAEVYPRVALPRGVPFAIATLTRYAVVVLGFLLAVAMLGFDLDRLTLLASALGVGVGFGLQAIVNNFVSGLILLFERPVKVGDRVELAELYGDVVNIGIRASTVRTFDGADVIVPNSVFISERVTNWTFSDKLRRIILPVGVAYGTDPDRVIRVLREVATSHPKTLDAPAPLVLFRGFGESSLDFEIRVFIDDYDRLLSISSELAVAANAALRREGIEIPFPQRDLHVRSVAETAARTWRGAPRSEGEGS